jgi:hypothetical protein
VVISPTGAQCAVCLHSDGHHSQKGCKSAAPQQNGILSRSLKLRSLVTPSELSSSRSGRRRAVQEVKGRATKGSRILGGGNKGLKHKGSRSIL